MSVSNAIANIPYKDRAKFYTSLNDEMRAYLDGSWLATLANASALLFQHLPEINWAGFYLFNGNELVLGPFQGRPACIRIRLGRGVCGTSAEQKKTLIVPDVELFAGHIACDSASRSEIVVPILHGDRLIGVLDVDAPIINRFSDADAQGLEAFTEVIIHGTKWPNAFID